MNLTWLLSLACSGQPQYQEACKQSTMATIEQSGLGKVLTQIEQESERRGRIYVYNYGLEDAVLAGAIVNDIVKNKGISISTDAPGVDKLNINAGLKGAGLGLNWSLD